MEFIVKRDQELQAVVIKASGMINTTEAEKMLLAAALELNIIGFQRCFFDLFNTEIDPQLTMTEAFMFVDAFKKAGISQSVRMAVFYSTGEEHRLHLGKATKFEGFNLKHFKDRREALNWLCQ